MVVGEAGSVAAARELAALRPDVALVDLGLADGDGRVEIAAMPADTRIIVMSQAPVGAAVEAIRAGAHGYLDKGSTADQVAQAVLTGPVLRALATGYDNREMPRTSASPSARSTVVSRTSAPSSAPTGAPN